MVEKVWHLESINENNLKVPKILEPSLRKFVFDHANGIKNISTDPIIFWLSYICVIMLIDEFNTKF